MEKSTNLIQWIGQWRKESIERLGKEEKERLKTKVRAGKAETKDGPYSWQQAKSLSQKNEGGSGLGAPHGG